MRKQKEPRTYQALDACDENVTAEVCVIAKHAMTIKEARAFARAIQKACDGAARSLRIMKARQRAGHEGVHRYPSATLKRLRESSNRRRSTKLGQP